MAPSSSLLGFHFKPCLFRCRNHWILLYFFPWWNSQEIPHGQQSLSWGTRMSCGMSWVQERSGLGTVLCWGGTFCLKGGRRGDDARSPWQRQCRDAGDAAVSWRGAGELLEVSCPDPGLNSSISGSVGCLGGTLQDLKMGIFLKLKSYLSS